MTKEEREAYRRSFENMPVSHLAGVILDMMEERDKPKRRGNNQVMVTGSAGVQVSVSGAHVPKKVLKTLRECFDQVYKNLKFLDGEVVRRFVKTREWLEEQEAE